jgi:CheY-like chemotaxis protein
MLVRNCARSDRATKLEALMETDAPAILIVDDNEDNRYTLQLLLEADGHLRLTTASGGHEALALLAREKFSLVLLDMMMPDLNGDEVLKIIKGNADTRDISAVVLSADTDTQRVSKCIEIGADDYLSKPFNPTILRARISSELRKRSLRSMENEYLERIEQVLISAATAKHLDEKDLKLDGPHQIETKEQRIIDTFFVSRNS